ncbi:MAG: NAD(P)-dependent glycerol-3-phosphate dehydrogenase [Actinomycetota bacterium]|nr:NAD(P)-dependent glycerol-3-phosphate dehydrogenase [Actinomycetota bacterium]
MNGEPRVAVIGAGSWGTAFATITAEKGVDTVLWARREELADEISSRHTNAGYLPEAELPPSLSATTDIAKAVDGAGTVVMAVPSHAFRAVFREVVPHLDAAAPVVSLAKGIEQDTTKRMTEVMVEEAGLPPGRVAVVSGPNLAREVVSRMPSASVVACADAEQARRLQGLFMAPFFRVYTNTDLVGCELSGAMKNPLAIAAGIADGMGFGDNSRASLITRGLAEMARLGVRMGGDPLTFAGLAGMGDLVATCISKLSRNRHVGEELGRGRRLEDVVGEMKMVAEGVKSSRPLVALAAREGVETPIIEHVVKVLYEGVAPGDMVLSLMLRSAKSELHGLRDGHGG